jgi:hypothetical protein
MPTSFFVAVPFAAKIAQAEEAVTGSDWEET